MFSSIWGKRAFSLGVFLSNLGSGALVLCFSPFGARLFSIFLAPLMLSWMAFGPRGSGQAALGQGPFFSNFWGRHFGSQNGHLDATQTHKNKRFSGHLCAKGGAQKSLEVSLVVPNVPVFPCFFANSGRGLSGPNGVADALLNWLCCLGGLGGCFLCVFVRGFSIKGAKWVCYLGGVGCAFSHFHTRIFYKSCQKQMVIRVVCVCHLQALAALLWPETDGSPSFVCESFASSGGPVVARNRW